MSDGYRAHFAAKASNAKHPKPSAHCEFLDSRAKCVLAVFSILHVGKDNPGITP
jgi:hypothetical protein